MGSPDALRCCLDPMEPIQAVGCEDDRVPGGVVYLVSGFPSGVGTQDSRRGLADCGTVVQLGPRVHSDLRLGQPRASRDPSVHVLHRRGAIRHVSQFDSCPFALLDGPTLAAWPWRCSFGHRCQARLVSELEYWASVRTLWCSFSWVRW